jgi:hypothetical protein
MHQDTDAFQKNTMMKLSVMRLRVADNSDIRAIQ